MKPNNLKDYIEKLSKPCINSIEESVSYSYNAGHDQVTILHFLLNIVEEEKCDVQYIFEYYNISKEDFRIALIKDMDKYKTQSIEKPVFAQSFVKILKESWNLSSIQFDEQSIRSLHILLAVHDTLELFYTHNFVSFLEKIDADELKKNHNSILELSTENKNTIVNNSNHNQPKQPEVNFLSKYCTDITQKARDNKIDAIFGRDNEIRLIVDILARRRKNNPICVGEPGVGKTAIVEGLALKIVEGDVPPVLENVKILELDLTLLQAGASIKGEFEKRLSGVISEVQNSADPIILFIDEAHTLIGAGGASGTNDAANLLKPALARGELRTIASTTWGEYKKYFEKDAALERRFQMVKLEEPDTKTAILILRGIKSYYEESHNVRIKDEAIVAAVNLSKKYIIGKFLPDKAIDLLDTACARIKVNLSSKPAILEDKEQLKKSLERENDALNREIEEGCLTIDKGIIEENITLINVLNDEIENLRGRWEREKELANTIFEKKQLLKDVDANDIEKIREELQIKLQELEELQKEDSLIHIEVSADLVAQVVSDWTGIPLGKMLRDETKTILELDKKLTEKIKGQEFAIQNITEVIQSSKSGIKNPNQPMGVFLFVGPSGVGKTQCALELADLLFGNQKSLTVINMSEFQEKHTVSRLIGSPPGYVGYGEGGMLSEAIRQKPYSVVLLDEVEKAHPDILNLFYQVFDKGILTDGEGKEISFKDTVIILASNLGSSTIQNFVENDPKFDMKNLLEAIRGELVEYFKPALFARMSILPFVSLSDNALLEIIKIKIIELQERVNNHKIQLKYDKSLENYILKKIKHSETGARNIEHIINQDILPELSKKILHSLNEDKELKEIQIKIKNDKITLK